MSDELLYPQLGNGFQLLITSRVARHREHLVVLCHTFVLLYYLSWYIQRTDIGFCVGFLSSGDNPQIVVKKCLQFFSVRFLTSEYVNPVKVEKMNRSRTSSCVLSGISVFIIVCILFRVQEILEVVNECKVQLFQRNILTFVGRRQELTDCL